MTNNKQKNWQTAINILADEIEKNRLVIFVGAGCSVYAGLPSWKDLIAESLNKINIVTKDSDFLRLASRIERKIGLKFREDLCGRLRTTPKLTSKIHDALFYLNTNLFVTTNYDHLLEDSFRKHGYSPNVIWQAKDIPSIDPSMKTIVKLHGDIDSPTSLVITAVDYTKFKSEQRPFEEYLNTVFSQNTILFLGTSFDDPRLKQIDDHILSLFKDARRNPFIILKSPLHTQESDLYDHRVELDDFNALCEYFEERGFVIIRIDHYDEIANFLTELRSKVMNKKVQGPSDIKSKLIIQTDYSEALEKKLRKYVDDETYNLSEKVRGNGILPPPSVMIQRAETLIQHLENPPHELSPESKLEGLLTVVDALLNAEKGKRISKAREYYERAAVICQGVSEHEKWHERLLRVRAKLLFFEGKKDDAIQSIIQSTDDKTTSLLLALLIDSRRIEEAYDLIKARKPHPSWVHEAIYILIYLGHLNEADEIFQKTMAEYESLVKINKVADSPFKGVFSCEKIYAAMSDALYRRALTLTGKEELSTVRPGDMTDDGRILCQKALKYIDDLNEKVPQRDLNESFFATLASTIDLSASYLLRNWVRADIAAKKLLDVKPIRQEVADYLVFRADYFKAQLVDIIKRLSEDYSDQSWAFTIIAIFEALTLKDYDKSWIAIQTAADLAASDEEKVKIARVAFDIGQAIHRLDSAYAIVEKLLSPEDLRRKFLAAHYQYLKGDAESAEEIFNQIEQRNPPPDIKAEILFMRAGQATKRKKWQEAKKLLKGSLKIFWHPLTARELLSVLTNTPNQDPSEVLKLSEDIESYGMEDETVIRVKAQAARILGQYKKAESAWRQLITQTPEKKEYKAELAEVLMLMEKYPEALKLIEPYLTAEHINLRFLAIACQSFELQGIHEKAFELLNENFDHFENEPQFLLWHIDLGYRTNHEIETQRSLQRLIILQKEGTVPKDQFFSLPIDEALKLLREMRQHIEDLNKLYIQSSIPRILLCDKKNIPLYLDWAFRTQPLTLPTDPKDWIEYTTYSTNGMRVDFVYGRNQLIPIAAPSEAKEIIIDLHALITVHRLGLIEALQRRYSTIYYPQVLRTIWLLDQKQFGHHQLSREKAYRSLDEKLRTNMIQELTAPEATEEDAQNDTFLKRSLRLAQEENLPCIDSYVKEEELKEYSEITIYRLAQVIEWLYTKGRLSAKEYNDLKKISGSEPVLKEDAFLREFDNTTRVIVNEVTLEVMETHGLIEKLINRGIKIVLEKATANFVRRAVLELDFGKKVEELHAALAETIKRANRFREGRPSIDVKHKIKFRKPYDEASIASLILAEEKDLCLLTDDRWTQMVRTRKLSNRQFGTDALLTDLYEKDIISLEKYAECFLDLCKWRYRFLIPDVRVLVYFANSYKDNPPGEPLTTIADYGRKTMQDLGLFMGPEATDPPIPLGIKMQIMWTNKWIEFLAAIWQEEDFSVEKKERLTRWVYVQALPGPPPNVPAGVFSHLSLINEKSIISHIFLCTTGANNPLKLNGLLEQTYNILGYDEDQQISVLRSHLEFILDKNKSKKLKKYTKYIAIQALKAAYGEKLFSKKVIIHVTLLPILNALGIKNLLKDGVKKPVGIEDDIENLFERRDDYRKRMPEYIPDGPLIIVQPEEKKSFDILIPHMRILSTSKKERADAIKDVLVHNYLTEYTKNIFRLKSQDILSDDAYLWRPASYNTSLALLKDFKYSLNIFTQLCLSEFPGLEMAINEVWNHTLKPLLDTVIEEMPLLIQDPFESDSIISRVKDGISRKDLVFPDKQTALSDKLDWYLENVYFIPVASPLNPWSIIQSISELTIKQYGESYSSVELLHAIQEWVKDKSDPLAHLMALELILCARANSKDDEHFHFTGEKFFEYLDGFFEVLMHEDKSDVRSEHKLIHTVWRMRSFLAAYFLKYIDINIRQAFIEDRRAILAWWMATQLMSALLKSGKHLKSGDMISWLEEIEKGIKRENDIIGLSHFFPDQQKYFSINRYLTLHGTYLLFSSVMAILMPALTNDEKITAFMGIKEPSTAFSPDFRDELFNKLLMHSFLGYGQIGKETTAELHLLWHVPLCISAPAFLRGYYADALDFLGKEKVGIIEMAESVTKPDSLENELKKIQDYLLNDQGLAVAAVISALHVRLSINGTVPEEVMLFKDYKTLVRDICKLTGEWQTISLSLLAQILDLFRVCGNQPLVEFLEKQFQNIDLSVCTEKSISSLIPHIVDVVLRGGDYTLLAPALKMKSQNKCVRETLAHVKSGLESIFPRTTALFRENIRRILNDLEDIPTIED